MNHTFVVSAVVLYRRPYGEYDSLATLYTDSMGKLPARFVGVRRPRGKLKALCEPMVHGEYRLYVRPSGEWATITGGRIVDSYPDVRADFDRTCQGLRLCELLARVVPDRSPNPRKFELIAESLSVLGRTGTPWLFAAFGARLLELAGFGLYRARPDAVSPELWDALHQQELSVLAARPDEPAQRGRVEARLEHAFEALVERPLATKIFLDSLRKTETAV